MNANVVDQEHATENRISRDGGTLEELAKGCGIPLIAQLVPVNYSVSMMF